MKKETAEKPKAPQRTSLVIDYDEYEYIKELKLALSFERKKDLSLAVVLSEVIRFHRTNRQTIEQKKIETNKMIDDLLLLKKRVKDPNELMIIQREIDKLRFLNEYLEK